ncbi:MFS transporter [Gulosibacter bifidus]|uniref:MFS transporter n=1 Tax=Gulosibacter bifidus TaxID=272239 RepID=A0ABW5RIM0_9MICO|nr:MFS transporter [Gulosibacter bifidus]
MSDRSNLNADVPDSSSGHEPNEATSPSPETEPITVVQAAQTDYNTLETGQISLDHIRDALEAERRAPEAPPRIPREIWALTAATFLIAIGFSLVVPVLPQYAESFGVSATLVTVVVSAFALVRLVSAPFAGRMLEGIGERQIYVIGLVIVAASSIAMAFAATYTQLLIFRGLGGIGSAMFTIAAASMIAKYSPPQIRGKISALWSGTFLIGNVTGPLFGGLLGQAGMTVPFISYGVALLLAAVVVSTVLRSTAKQRTDGADAPKPALTLAHVWSNKSFRASLVFSLANGWANMGIRIAVVPLFVGVALTHEPWAAGLVVAVGAIGNMIALQWSGRASDRRGRRPLIIAGLLVSAIGVVGMIWADRLEVVLAAMFVSGLGSGLSMPVSQAAMSDIIGRDHTGGRPLSVFQMMQDLGMILGPMIAGVLIDVAGYSWAFGVASVVLLLPVVAWLLAPDTISKRAN